MLKTQPGQSSAKQFVENVEHPRRRADGLALLQLFNSVTGAKPVLWGDSLIGYGHYDYTYRSGHSGSWFITGFSPRKQHLVVYLLSGFDGLEDDLNRLGKHRLGKCCVYLNKLEDVDRDVLAALIKKSVSKTLKRYDGKMD